MNHPNNISSSDPEFRRDTPFEQAYDTACRRFAEALDIANSRYQHVGLDTSPDIDNPLAVLKLADDYDAAIEGRGDSFEVGLPIVPADANFIAAHTRPRLAELEEPYFMVRQTRGGKQHFVTPTTYAEQLQGSKPVVADFSRKLGSYAIIPLRFSAGA